jgi:hypothetical protein
LFGSNIKALALVDAKQSDPPSELPAHLLVAHVNRFLIEGPPTLFKFKGGKQCYAISPGQVVVRALCALRCAWASLHISRVNKDKHVRDQMGKLNRSHGGLMLLLHEKVSTKFVDHRHWMFSEDEVVVDCRTFPI